MKNCIIILLIALVFLKIPAIAQENNDPVSIGTYKKLYSKILNEERILLVHLPRGYNETTIRYPVLYILYGGQVEGYFAEAVHIVRRLSEGSIIPEMIIVGIKNTDRYRDCLPINRNGEQGGAADFLKFFEEELIPYADKSYRTKEFRILGGPQAGATFGLYALVEDTDLFNATIITNPFWITSIREYMISKSNDFFNKEQNLKSFLFISTYPSNSSNAMIEYLEKFRSITENGKQNNFTLIINEEKEDEDDVVTPIGLRKGLKEYFKDYKFPNEIEIEGLEDLKEYYQNLSQKYDYDVDIPEFTLVRQGDKLEERGKLEEAKIVFEYIVDKYPHDLNSYARLADLHRRWGNYNLAVQYYEQLLKREKMPYFEEKLNSLEKYLNESAVYEIEKVIIDSGINAGIEEFHTLNSNDQNTLIFSENDFINLGYSFISRSNINAAIEVFKMNIEMYPASADAYSSLGEAYMKAGDKKNAIIFYNKSLALDPENANIKEILKELKK